MNCILASARTFPPWLSEGWTLIGIERDSRYLVSVQVGQRDRDLFTRGIAQTWAAVQRNKYIRLFSDGERRYASELWKLASVRLDRKYGDYQHRKVWREGIELAIKIKGSQGHPRREWVNPEHPFTAISSESDVHANHNEALNSAIRRKCSAYRRRQNTYAKNVAGLKRAITVQRLIHNWVRPHQSCEKGTTPAMVIGLYPRPIPLMEFLTTRGFYSLPN